MEKIPLGSGKVYVVEHTSTVPTATEIEKEDNLLGYIQSGATISYTPTFYEAKDDLNIVSKKVITDEEAVLKSGVMTWNGITLAKLCSTARVTEDTTGKTRTVKIGGLGNYDGKKYVIHFLHGDSVDGKTRVTIVGSNEAGFEMAFGRQRKVKLICL